MSSRAEPTAEDILRMLRKKHELDSGFVCVDEFDNGTGGRVDLAAIGIWRSTLGFHTAYEIKVTRKDLLRELKDPVKNERVPERFHRCYFVCARGVAEPDDIPAPWGLYEATPKRLRKVRACKPSENAAMPPEAWAKALQRVCRQGKRVYELPDGHLITSEEFDEMVRQAVEFEKQALAERVERYKALKGRLGELDALLRSGGEEPDSGRTLEDLFEERVRYGAQLQLSRVRSALGGARYNLERLVELLKESEERVAADGAA